MKQTDNADDAGLTPDLFTITDLETLKAVSSPFRQNLMRLMSEKPRTVKEMAEELDMPPSRLYYHINQLAKHGIIRVAKTQIVSGIVEKHYQISARAFRVDRALLAPGGGNDDAIIDVLMAGTLDAAEKEIRQVADGNFKKLLNASAWFCTGALAFTVSAVSSSMVGTL